ncbi:DUF6103 family protein [Pelotomaculum propionicicum]|uniref:Uncharacterized protein n=1 Tax=Pelotomaculum propionicicum TaxID=258475 RepID=A0A4Y7RMK6_9FIRM|nr:DUF6103 family protein [Pelotomaculum propionicicum]NLI13785.1 hypothetical protein [Peptococcaceae bacterium]TEB10224.1 hypothetical protein Pmgp_02524 [Pelotomaculum propionicicum]
MRETELKILFPTEKLDALRFFMAKKELTVEQELKETLDRTYEKVVPAHVREYVESRLDQVPAQEPAPEPEAQERQPEAQRQSRQTRRQREQAAAEPAPVLDSQGEDTGPAEEESQGITMSM